jgi:hypothetical protein
MSAQFGSYCRQVNKVKDLLERDVAKLEAHITTVSRQNEKLRKQMQEFQIQNSTYFTRYSSNAEALRQFEQNPLPVLHKAFNEKDVFAKAPPLLEELGVFMEIQGNVKYGASIEMKVEAIQNLISELEKENLDKTRKLLSKCALRFM